MANKQEPSIVIIVGAAIAAFGLILLLIYLWIKPWQPSQQDLIHFSTVIQANQYICYQASHASKEVDQFGVQVFRVVCEGDPPRQYKIVQRSDKTFSVSPW